MKSNRVIAGLIFLAFVGAAIASEDVLVGSRSTKGNSILVYDAGTDAESAVEALRFGEVDFIRFGNKPGTACNDAVDCATTIKDTCALVDPDSSQVGIVVTYNGILGTCSGTCTDGQSVTVVCVR